MRLNWQAWVYGLFAALIGGGAGSVTSVIGVSIVLPGQVGLSGNAGWNSLKLMGVTFMVHGFVAAFAYLSKSPLPQRVETKVEVSQQTDTEGTVKTTASVTKTGPESKAAE
jgi:hypothetical protein